MLQWQSHLPHYHSYFLSHSQQSHPDASAGAPKMFWFSTHSLTHSRRGATVTKQQSLGGGQSYRHGNPHSFRPSFFGGSRPGRALPATRRRHQQSRTLRTHSNSNTGHVHTPTWPGVWLLLAEVHVMRLHCSVRRCKITQPSLGSNWCFLSHLFIHFFFFMQYQCIVIGCSSYLNLNLICFKGTEKNKHPYMHWLYAFCKHCVVATTYFPSKNIFNKFTHIFLTNSWPNVSFSNPNGSNNRNCVCMSIKTPQKLLYRQPLWFSFLCNKPFRL